MSHIAIIGCGLVGSSSALVFRRAGFDVVLLDDAPVSRMGPFETIDLNAPNGIAEYCRNVGAMYHGLAREQADPRPWTSALVAGIEADRRKTTPAERRAWRDRCLAALVAAKRLVLAGQGRTP